MASYGRAVHVGEGIRVEYPAAVWQGESTPATDRPTARWI